MTVDEARERAKEEAGEIAARAVEAQANAANPECRFTIDGEAFLAALGVLEAAVRADERRKVLRDAIGTALERGGDEPYAVMTRLAIMLHQAEAEQDAETPAG